LCDASGLGYRHRGWRLLKFKAGQGRLVFFQPVSLHDGQPVAIEHKPDIDEEKTGIGAAKQKLFFKKLTLAALIGSFFEPGTKRI
jgi:hypothetical protein